MVANSSAATDTFFASAERASDADLTAGIEILSNNPVADALLKAASGLLAVLNEQRQVLVVNQKLLDTVGVADPHTLLGLRPGEVVNCVHAHDAPNGCGTTPFCPSCGAAVAMVTSLTSAEPVEKICAVTVEKNGQLVDLCLSVRSCPVTIEDRRFLLLFMQDVTPLQTWAALEQVFFHDIVNLVQGLTGASGMMADADPREMSELATEINGLARQLAQEIAVQRALLHSQSKAVKPKDVIVPLQDVMQGIRETFANHPAARGRRLGIPQRATKDVVVTDPVLLRRILCNMVKNALEATDDGEEARLWCETSDDAVEFLVWNHRPIPDDIAKRVFQRHFSTKEGLGRGLGTFGMRILGEDVLGGKVSFTTSEKDGTVFRLSLPRKRPANPA